MFCYHPPWKKVIAFIWTNLNPLQQRCFRPSLVEIDPLVLKKKILKFCRYIFFILLLSPFGIEGDLSFEKQTLGAIQNTEYRTGLHVIPVFRLLMNPDFIWIAVAIYFRVYYRSGTGIRTLVLCNVNNSVVVVLELNKVCTCQPYIWVKHCICKKEETITIKSMWHF